ncbi:MULTISPECIES: hypothetical protein [unclassified Streptomyces]|uniref:hypothetical protein n=1 Tax=unclassified Streptomyces TaxID=2593676 RepID=UPI0036E07178
MHHHPSHTPTGPADLALPLALVTELTARGAGGATRAPEIRTTRTPASRKRRAARRRAAAVRG